MSDFASVNGLEQSSGRAAPSAQTAQLTGRLHKHKNRKKEEKPSALLRTWVCIHPSGESSVVQVDKLSLSAQLGIQPRDLRLLESQLAGQTSVILCREGAIVINMAFVKAIITTAACYLVSPDDPQAMRFMADLTQRLAAPMRASKSAGRLAGTGQGGGAAAWGGAVSRLAGPGGGQGGAGGKPEVRAAVAALEAAEAAAKLPFELQVLEICLDELACDLDDRATQLEGTAYPAVDAMAKQPSPVALERVRHVKNRLVRLTKVTETFREVLEALLDDDRDMWDMNLSAKEQQRAAAEEVVAQALEASRTALAAVQEEVEGAEGEGEGEGAHHGHGGLPAASALPGPLTLDAQDPAKRPPPPAWPPALTPAWPPSPAGSVYTPFSAFSIQSHVQALMLPTRQAAASPPPPSPLTQPSRPPHPPPPATSPGPAISPPPAPEPTSTQAWHHLSASWSKGLQEEVQDWLQRSYHQQQQHHHHHHHHHHQLAGEGRQSEGGGAGGTVGLSAGLGAASVPLPWGMLSLGGHTSVGAVGQLTPSHHCLRVPLTGEGSAGGAGWAGRLAPAASPSAPYQPLSPLSCSPTSLAEPARQLLTTASTASSPGPEGGVLGQLGVGLLLDPPPARGPEQGAGEAVGGSGGRPELEVGPWGPGDGQGQGQGCGWAGGGQGRWWAGEGPRPSHHVLEEVEAAEAGQGGPLRPQPQYPPPSPLPQHSSLRELVPLGRLSRRSLVSMRSNRSGGSGLSLDSSALSDVFHEEVAVVEMLLEAYFMHIDFVHNRLKTLGEYVEDTEDLVNISLDAQRNRLISCDLLFSGVNTISITLTGLTGMFTMNLLRGSWDEVSVNWLLVVVVGSLGLYTCFALLISFFLARGVVRFS